MKNELTEKEMELWNKIGNFDPLLFLRGYSSTEINKIIKDLDMGTNEKTN